MHRVVYARECGLESVFVFDFTISSCLQSYNFKFYIKQECEVEVVVIWGSVNTTGVIFCFDSIVARSAVQKYQKHENNTIVVSMHTGFSLYFPYNLEG